MKATSTLRRSAAAATAPPGTPLPGASKRLVVRRSRAVWPFVWRGLVPLLGLVFVAWYAVGPMARSIESSVRAEVRTALDLRGFHWVGINVSGQDVVLSGVVPTTGASGGATAPAQALSIARGATCSAWVVRSPCAVAVMAKFTDASTAPAVVAAARVPTTTARANATNAMTLPPVASSPVVTAPPAAPAPAASPPAAPPVAQGTNTLAALKACDAEMKRLLAASRIEFETGQAVITALSAPLLDQLATAAITCPGVVQVEGHTDTVGGANDNQKLSVARAFAVRDALVQRGLSPTQLLAEGFGEDKPVASNKTPDGRAKNRRIELRALAPPNL